MEATDRIRRVVHCNIDIDAVDVNRKPTRLQRAAGWRTKPVLVCNGGAFRVSEKDTTTNREGITNLHARLSSMPVLTSSFMCGVLTSSSFCECLVHNNRAQSVTRFLQRSRDSGGRGPAGDGPAEIVSPVRTDATETARKMFSPVRLWSLQQHDYMRLRALVWRWRRPVVLGCRHRVDPAMLRKAPLVPPVDRQ